MQYIEPREATINFNDVVFTGKISGTTNFVKFVSNDVHFLQIFPTGEFDTMLLDRNTLSRAQRDIIDFAQALITQRLK